MTVTATIKRRRKQSLKNNRHLAKMGRPGLPKKVSEAQSAAKQAREVIRAQKKASAGKAKKKAKS